MRALSAAACIFGLFSVSVACGDVFVLSTGGEIRGELLNANEKPRRHYQIRPYAGGKVTLAAAMVTNVLAQRPVDVAYDQERLERGDGVADHWQLAEWCRINRLNVERQRHLDRILQLDPDHAEVRRLLGYERVGDAWMTREEKMKQRGYVKHGGRWMLPQEVELIAQRNETKLVEKKWFENLRRWRSWLERSEKAAAAEEFILATRSPHAVDALIRNLDESKNYRHKEIFAEALSNVGTGRAFTELAKHVVEHDASSRNGDNEDFRYHCLDLIEQAKPPVAVTIFINGLKSPDNRHINRAALGLARMGDATAVEPLIDALVTTHKYNVGKGNPGAMTTGFGSGPGGRGSTFGTGGGPKIVTRNLRNEDVLAALNELTGKDFDFDLNSWRTWYATQKPPVPRINTRRD